jgi:hypothetical protein
MPTPVHYIPILTTILAIVFAPIVFKRWQRRKPAPHLWWWALGPMTSAKIKPCFRR